MKRGLLVLACLGLLTSICYGDYVIIRINLSASEEDDADTQSGPGPGGPGGKGGAGLSGPGMGGPGGKGGAGLSGPGMGGPGGGKGGSNQAPPGYPGSGGGMGLPGGGRPPGGPGGQPEEKSAEAKPNIFVVVVDGDWMRRTGKETDILSINSRWGHGSVDLKLLPEKRVEIQPQKHALLKDQFESQKVKLMKEDPFKFGEWILKHWNLPVTDDSRFGYDMEKKFEEYIDDLARTVSKDDAKAQTRVKALVAAKEQLHKPLGSAEEEMNRLKPIVGDSFRYRPSEHYVIAHQPRAETVAAQKLKRLEHAYAAFYYWFALQGQTLPAPAKQLICVLADDSKDFDRLHGIFDKLPLASDGFFSTLDNVLVISPTREDAIYRQQFLTLVSDVDNDLGKKGLSLSRLVKDEKLSKQDKDAFEPKELAFARVVALAREAAQEEGEISTVTHEVTQQLAAATGLLPRYVQVPQAIRLGLGSFFEACRSNSEWDLAAPWTGVGSLSWTYLPLYRKIKEAERSGYLVQDEKTPYERKVKVERPSILKIISDKGFLAADRGDKSEKDILYDKARAEAWALTYYLAWERLPNLQRFYAELSRMPRDMELTPDIVEQAFAIAFDLQDKQNPHKVDALKLASLDKDWHAFMDFQQLEVKPPQWVKPAPKKDK